MKDKEYLESIYKKGAIKAKEKARKTLEAVYNKVGLIY